MTDFIDIIAAFPTVLFAFSFALTSLYWVFVLMGAADLELLDGFDGLMEGLDGAADAVDGTIDAAAEAVSEGASEGTAEVIDAAGSGFAPLLFIANLFRLGRIPMTISLTFFAVAGFAVSFLLTWLWVHFPHVMPYAVFAAGNLVISTAGGLAITNLACRPFEPIFKLNSARERSSLVGEACELTTGRTDDEFGQAMAQLQGDDLLFQVRCDSQNSLVKGSRALIVSFDDSRQAYVVEPLLPNPSPQPQREVQTS